MEREPSEALLLPLAEAMERFRARLAQQPRRLRSVGFTTSEEPGATWSFDYGMKHFSPVSGSANPLSPPLKIRMETDRVTGTVCFPPPFAGRGGTAHTGHVAASFDELLGAALSLAGQPGMTGILEVEVHHPVPIGKRLSLEGRIRKVRGPLVFTEGSLQAGGSVMARAEGIFFQIDEAIYEQLAQERNQKIRTGP
jgi:acyl-coenzyme A thioesterase PaaI-like protein